MRIFGPLFTKFSLPSCSPAPFACQSEFLHQYYPNPDWALVLGKLDSNTPKITHFGPEKSYLRTRLRDFWPQKSYSRTRKSEIFALKNPIFQTTLGWSFTGPIPSPSLPDSESRVPDGSRIESEQEVGLAIESQWVDAALLSAMTAASEKRDSQFETADATFLHHESSLEQAVQSFQAFILDHGDDLGHHQYLVGVPAFRLSDGRHLP
jgi:hypothetical protein